MFSALQPSISKHPVLCLCTYIFSLNNVSLAQACQHTCVLDTGGTKACPKLCQLAPCPRLIFPSPAIQGCWCLCNRLQKGEKKPPLWDPRCCFLGQITSRTSTPRGGSTSMAPAPAASCSTTEGLTTRPSVRPMQDEPSSIHPMDLSCWRTSRKATVASTK